MYVGLAQRAGGSMLEYGVGNGRIALPVARHGIRVTGVDLAAPMLADLRRRLRAEAPAVRTRVTLRRGDMRALSLGKRFPLVICPFNTALHLYTRDDVERFFARVHEHLAPGGLFVSDLSVPLAENLARAPSKPFGTPPFRHAGTGEVVKYRERFDYDAARQVLFVSMEFEPKGAKEREWHTPLTHRQFYPQEWEALLHYNGFEVEAVHGDFEGGPLDRYSDTMVWHARAARRGHKSRRESRGSVEGRTSAGTRASRAR